MEDYQRLLPHAWNEVEDEKNDETTVDGFRRSPHPGVWRSNASWKTVLQIYIALIASCVCMLQIWILCREARPDKLNGPAPPRHTVDMAFVETQYHRDTQHMSLDHQYDHLWHWENLTYLVIPEPEPDLDSGKEVPAAISMFHQLHCLSSFRTALQKGYEGEPIGFDQHDNAHWPHCLDYLRKTILCYADNTLELPRKFDSQHRSLIIDGTLDARSCRSSEALFDLGNMAWPEARQRFLDS